jgi:DnaJ family protein C protein 1
LRWLTLPLSPDKNLGVKNIEERFARLGVVGTILRNPESRKRYDFFYKNGVPKWRGTGYYYARFRPGVGVRQLLAPSYGDSADGESRRL